MESAWNNLDPESLKALYEAESQQLKKNLLSGVSWEETKEQRKKLAALSASLQKMTGFSENPAESPGRDGKRVRR
jgi:hypothetical protein